jgi:chemotaxis protein histidine kinase CheA
MKKMFIASCIMAAAVFAAPAAKAPAAAPAAAAPAKTAEPAAAPAKTEAKAEQPKAEAKAEPAPAKAEAKAEQPKADAKAEPAPAKTEAKAEQPKAEAKAEPAPAKTEAKPAEAKPAEAAAAPAEEKKEEAAAPAAEEVKTAEAAPAEEKKEEAKAEEVKKAEEAAPAAEVAAAEPEKKPAKKKKRKKKKMIENAVMTVNQINFDINADFELEAGKVLWSSEDDELGDNFETWNGEANFAVLAEANDFKGKIGIAFYPGDLQPADDNNVDKKVKKAQLREGSREYVNDYFSLDEAWAMQETDLFSFKVGRWDNTDKSGDYFGGYIDGYKAGFLSTQDPENQLQFGFTPTDNMSAYISFISKSENLDKGDVRAVFNFHGLDGLGNLKVQLGYRSNVFDVVYDAGSKIKKVNAATNDTTVIEQHLKHNASLKANLPIVANRLDIFAEAALMDLSDDLVIPVTGGIAIYTPVVDRILIEAEYVGDRHEHKDFYGIKNPKHVKDVLGALYLEKAFTSRFSLSAGFHNYGCTKDYMISGNLVGRIN